MSSTLIIYAERSAEEQEKMLARQDLFVSSLKFTDAERLVARNFSCVSDGGRWLPSAGYALLDTKKPDTREAKISPQLRHQREHERKGAQPASYGAEILEIVRNRRPYGTGSAMRSIRSTRNH